jgi:type II secretory pathway component PulC
MKFIIEERIPCVQVWTYEVEANNETEALNIALDGVDMSKTEIADSVVIEHDYENAQYEIEEVDKEAE